jgi:hypothetical protein
LAYCTGSLVPARIEYELIIIWQPCFARNINLAANGLLRAAIDEIP